MPSGRYAAGERFIEGKMLDKCTVTRDSELVYDDVLDEETGVLVKPDPDKGTVYSGKCLVKAAKPDEVNQAGLTRDLPTHAMLVPKKVTNIRFMDRVTVRSRDARITADQFVVRHVDESTHVTYRRVLMRKVLNDG